MKIIEVRHMGIAVKDMDKSLEFYRDLLGFKIMTEMNESGKFISNIMGLNEVKVRTVKMKSDSGPTLVELLEFKSHRDHKEYNREIYDIGPSHLALTVDNLDEVHTFLSNAGVEFKIVPQLSPDGYAKVTFCVAPEGTLVELVEVLK